MNGPDGVKGPDLGDRYRILRVLGEGGMGTVFLAEDLRHDRQVAIKTIRGDFVTEDVIQRFEREIKLTSSLQHPRILPLLDSGIANGSLYYVMQFIEGESLDERLKREQQLRLDDALRIARHVADALDHAHSKGVVHRDIKPANIMLSGDHALVMDFGIARALAAGDTSLTATGSALGTPLYMSPEQASDSSAVDGRSDIYALGCVLYEMIAGHPPFTGPSVHSILRQHLTADPPDPAVHRPGTPPDVSAAILRAMEKVPADRFKDAGEFAATLRSLAGGPDRDAPARRPRTAALVVVGYLAGAWGLLAIVERVAEVASLPSWTVPFALVLLLIGLLVVGATIILQATGAHTISSGTLLRATGARTARDRKRHGFRSWFRWRNVVAGGILASALWGLIAVWLMFLQPESGGAELDGSAVRTGIEATDTGVDAIAAAGPDSAATTAEDAAPPVIANDENATPGAAEGRPVRSPEAGARPTQPSAAETDDAGAAAVEDARERARTARQEAEGAGARVVAAPSLVVADSLWEEAVGAAQSGPTGASEGLFDRAGEAYREVGREARSLLSSRLDSTRSALDSLRQRADPSAPAYAVAESLVTGAREAEATGDLASALGTLGRAGDAYERAIPPVGARAPSPEDPSTEDDPEPIEPSPLDRVTAVMTQLEQAFEAEDVAAVQRIWVNLTPGEVKSFDEFFAEGHDLDYSYEIQAGSIRAAPDADAVEFRVTIRWEYEVDRGGRVRAEPFQQAFRLARSGARDVLTSL